MYLDNLEISKVYKVFRVYYLSTFVNLEPRKNQKVINNQKKSK